MKVRIYRASDDFAILIGKFAVVLVSRELEYKFFAFPTTATEKVILRILREEGYTHIRTYDAERESAVAQFCELGHSRSVARKLEKVTHNLAESFLSGLQLEASDGKGNKRVYEWKKGKPRLVESKEAWPETLEDKP